jgi:hypothetical protein
MVLPAVLFLGAAKAMFSDAGRFDGADGRTSRQRSGKFSETIVQNAAADDGKTSGSEQKSVMRGDNRPDALRVITRGWNTDWNRRTIDYSDLRHGGPPRDGIPSIDDPRFIEPGQAQEWLGENEPVIAFVHNGEARAYPIQILIWHEIVNDQVAGLPVLITFCPLCNASIVFDRRVGSETYEFGTSGLLRNSDLVMYDRTTESLWQQLTGEGIAGKHAGERLRFLPSSIVSYREFMESHPDGMLLSRNTGYGRAYGRNPYVGYDRIGQSPFLFDGNVDGRLQAMERVVAVSIVSPDSGREIDIAYPYSILAEKQVINDSPGGVPLVVFYAEGTASALDAPEISGGRDVGSTGVYSAVLNGERLTFAKKGSRIIDIDTGSTWDIFGRAIKGKLRGRALEPVVHGNHFWFAWAAFKPRTKIYGA